ncbi:MAG TPA: glycoside hydrolase family 76 protein, partial [Verrucomicrobium sp.]|nr:glycoside hydrolase family 76 protein [Verrucomicrobium sp.]
MISLSRPSRRSLLKIFAALAGGGNAVAAASQASTAVEAGLKVLDERYWCDPISIWLDREGDQLRAHWEGRVNAPWWSAANAVELMVDCATVTQSKTFDARLEAMHDLQRDPVQRWPRVAEALRKKGQWSAQDDTRLAARMARPSRHTEFRNEYLDDSAWWAIAWLKMYDRTRDAKYLATARAIHAHMLKNWRPDLDGGVIWCEETGKQKPNAITNGLYLILSSRLAVRVPDGGYREPAGKAIAWLHEKQLFDGRGVVDAPGHVGDWWSYNQGVYLGGLVEYAALTGEPRHLDEAARVIEAVLTQAGFMDADGIVVEKLGTSGWDGCLFKGIFARYLAQ